jgi:hypothetical protein
MKQFEATQKARKVRSLETMIGDIQALDSALSQQITAEEGRTRVSDPRRPDYSIVALAAAARRSRLAATLTDLRTKLDAAKRDHEALAREVHDLEVALGVPAASTTVVHAKQAQARQHRIRDAEVQRP